MIADAQFDAFSHQSSGHLAPDVPGAIATSARWVISASLHQGGNASIPP